MPKVVRPSVGFEECPKGDSGQENQAEGAQFLHHVLKLLLSIQFNKIAAEQAC